MKKNNVKIDFEQIFKKCFRLSIPNAFSTTFHSLERCYLILEKKRLEGYILFMGDHERR